MPHKKNINKDDVALDFQGDYYTQVEIAAIHGCSKQRIGQILDEKSPRRPKQNGEMARTEKAIRYAQIRTGIK